MKLTCNDCLSRHNFCPFSDYTRNERKQICMTLKKLPGQGIVKKELKSESGKLSYKMVKGLKGFLGSHIN